MKEITIIDSLSDLSALPGSVRKNAELHFSQGVYSFSPEKADTFSCSLSNSDPSSRLSAGILLNGAQDLVLDGQGSTLLCHGQMSAAALLSCRNITLKNFTIDWDIPLTAEGKITAACAHYIDLSVDPEKFPFSVKDGVLFFHGSDQPEPLHCWGHTEFDPETDLLARNRGDQFPPVFSSLLPNGQIRMSGDFTDKIPAVGNILVLRHGQRIHPAILIHNCKHIRLENIRIHASAGLGILAQFSENLVFSHLDLVPNRAKGRFYAGLHDDGIHLSANSGFVLVEHCRFLGLMDDPINLHGIAVKLEKQPKGDIYCGKFMHPQSKGHSLWAEPGNRVACLSSDTMEELTQAIVKNFRLLDDENFEITFSHPLSIEKTQSCSSFSLENLSWTASLICRNNYFGACRARGLLVTTDQKVLIEGNTFQSSGAAIRIAGDVCTWYESGRCQDVTIQDNYFSDSCLSNIYQGGQGIISISPELPRPDPRFPCHRNIRIQHNRFCLSDSRILYALCTDGILFSDNQIIKSSRYPYRKASDSFVTLDHCKNADIRGCVFSGP